MDHEASVQVPTLIADDSGQLHQLKDLYVKLWDKSKKIQTKYRNNIVKDVISELPSPLSNLLLYPIDEIFIVKAHFHPYGIPRQGDEMNVVLHMPPKYLILTCRYRINIYWVTDELNRNPEVRKLIKLLEGN
ncbi:hypothetical protein ODV19_04460 [Lactobacillus amylovorus]|uniref:Uncharacterized protein n=1 Tax=Lactobacillus amylovorus TaxID=1604 RepID=A0AAW6B9A0_LACAM|nr:hypothetical protein [Lactobacillus amylovorus]MDA6089263.1 hypothetical protein [Lactobacillus amylovorus]MDB6246523.1 hypothetical protein [Lactobacillus amylovorus]